MHFRCKCINLPRLFGRMLQTSTMHQSAEKRKDDSGPTGSLLRPHVLLRSLYFCDEEMQFSSESHNYSREVSKMHKNCTKDCRQWAPPSSTKVTTHWAHYGLVHSTDLTFFRISSPNMRNYSQKLAEIAYKCARRCHELSKVQVAYVGLF